jgi:hypothetical protein
MHPRHFLRADRGRAIGVLKPVEDLQRLGEFFRGGGICVVLALAFRVA